MRKLLGFSLLLLAVMLMAGCSNDKEVSISIMPNGVVDIQANETLFLQVNAKNSTVIMPDPASIEGSFRMVGSMNVQYTAPEDAFGPNDVPVKEVTFTVVAAEDKSKTASVTFRVMPAVPVGTIDPANITLMHGAPGQLNRQFTAIFKAVGKSKDPFLTNYDTPRFRLIPNLRPDANGVLVPDEIGEFYDAVPDEVTGNSYSYTGLFIHSQINSGRGTIEATLNLDPALYGLDGKGNIRQAKAITTVAVRPPSDRFQWVTLFPDVGYGTSGTTAPVLTRPFFSDMLDYNEYGDYVVYQSCNPNNATQCQQRFVRRDNGVREGAVLENAEDQVPSPYKPFPIASLRNASPGRTMMCDNQSVPIGVRCPLDPINEAVSSYMPEYVAKMIPSVENLGTYGGIHAGLTSLEQTDFDETVAVFEISLNQWPPVARIVMAVWRNDITEDDVIEIPVLNANGNPRYITSGGVQYPVTEWVSDKVIMKDVLASYSIVPFSFNAPMKAKLGVTKEPKPPKNYVALGGDDVYTEHLPDPELNGATAADTERYLTMMDKFLKRYYGRSHPEDPLDIAYGQEWALGYYNGDRLAVRRVNFMRLTESDNPVQGKAIGDITDIRLADVPIRWHPLSTETVRAYFTDLVFENYDQFVAIGTWGELDAQSAFMNVTAWRYQSGLAMVRRPNDDYETQHDAWEFGPCLEYEEAEEGEEAECIDRGPNWEALLEAAQLEWDELYGDLGEDEEPDVPRPTASDEEYREPEIIETGYEYLSEMLGLRDLDSTQRGRFEISYAIRDDYDEGKLILAGYGISPTGAMTGFMAKSYDDTIGCAEGASVNCRSEK